MPDEPELREHMQALRSQLKATTNVLRTSIQLLAQADALLEQASTAERGTANGQHSRDTVRVG